MDHVSDSSFRFRPRARLLLQLGDQLIKNAGIALFELVKNSYDADANNVSISFNDINSKENGKIIITDNGSGMTLATILNVWLEPGTNFREQQIKDNKRSPKYKRLPLGQKGIGRFGAHKLGKKITLITRFKKSNEIVLTLDWNVFEDDVYLDEKPITVIERKPIIFKGPKTGTQIIISDIREAWNRGKIRNVYRAVNSICSPFESPDSFDIEFTIDDEHKHSWLDGLLNWKDVLKLSLYKADCKIDKKKLDITYNFHPWDTLTKVTKRTVKLKNIDLIDIEKKSGKVLDLSEYSIGPIIFNLHIFDQDAKLLSMGVPDRKGFKEFLNFNGGIRVYRDGVRVYDYGELGNDWLGLGTRRINVPTNKLSNNIIIGSVHIEREKSADLEEKTNREGFIDNPAVEAFQKSVLYALFLIEIERNKDKQKIRFAYSKQKQRSPVFDDISNIRSVLSKNPKLSKDIDPFLDRIESDFKDIQDKLLVGAGAGLSLSIVIHEVEKLIEELKLVIKSGRSKTRAVNLANHLAELIEGYAVLVRKDKKSNYKATEIIEQALFNVEYRLSAHNIDFSNKSLKKDNFSFKGSKRLLLNSVMNLIDNSIWWLNVKNPNKKCIIVKPTLELEEGPAIIVGDNGTGITDELKYLAEPFFTRKPDGMGLGLHIASEVMKVHHGKIKILEVGEVNLPKYIDGAIIALIFPK